MSKITEEARGRWGEIVGHLCPSLAPAIAAVGTTKHFPCPMHGGENGDAFRLFEDFNEKGGGICNTCGSYSNGFALIAWLTSSTYEEAVERVAEYLGVETRPARKVVKHYTYTDADGNPIYRVCRTDPKGFFQQHFDGADWKRGLNGTPTVLYNLAAIGKADAGDTIYLVEGEKDADALGALGLIATTCPMGAGKWSKRYSETLEGRRVVILPDADEPGREHAAKVANQLHGKAATVKVVELPELPEKGDVSDWLAAGGTPERLRELVDGAAEWTPTAKAATKRREKPDLLTHKVEAKDGADSVDAACMAEHRTDLGNARRLVHRFGRDIRFVVEWKKWLAWDGTRWVPDADLLVQRYAQETVTAIYREASLCNEMGDRALLAEWARDSEHTARIAAMMTQARALEGVPVRVAELDQHPFLLNCPNGTVDLKTGDLLPHERSYLLTQLCPTNYDPEAECTKWEEVLDTCFAGSNDLIEYLWRFGGYALTGNVREQILPVAWGGGANGKSTILITLADTLGDDYAFKAPRDLIVTKRGERHPTELASLYRKRLVAVIETGEGQRLDEVLIKELTGGDTISARRMREDFWNFKPTHKLIISTNHRPRVTGTDLGVWRRLRLIPFTVSIPPDKIIKGMDEILVAEEAPGILAWLVRGCVAWQADGLKTPEAVNAATAEYRSAEDIVGQFIDEKCTVGEHRLHAKAGELYAAYADWCESRGDRPRRQTDFGKSLTERGFSQHRGTGGARSWLGIALNDWPEE